MVNRSPVVHSIVSLTVKSIVKVSLSLPVPTVSNAVIFLLKNVNDLQFLIILRQKIVAFSAKVPHNFLTKNGSI